MEVGQTQTREEKVIDLIDFRDAKINNDFVTNGDRWAANYNMLVP